MITEVKIIKIGNSLGFIIPKLIIKALGWEVGDLIEVEFDSKKKRLICTKKS